MQHIPQQLHCIKRPGRHMFCITSCGPRTKRLEIPGLYEGIHSRLAIEGKNIFIYYLFPNIYMHIYQWILFS